MEKTKSDKFFEGILGGIHVNSFKHKRIFPFLIEKDIYVLADENELNDDIHFEFQGKANLAETYIYNNKIYKINEKAVEECFYSMERHIEKLSEYLRTEEENELQVSLLKIIDTEDKIIFLKSYHKGIFKNDHGMSYNFYKAYSDYREGIEVETWKLLAREQILENSLSKFFIDYPWYAHSEFVQLVHHYYNVFNTSKYIEEIIQELKSKSKTESNSKFVLRDKVILLEKIRAIKNWDEMSANKRGDILQELLGHSKREITRTYSEHNKKSVQFKKDLFEGSDNKINAFLSKLGVKVG